jgi:hypothetical protein
MKSILFLAIIVLMPGFLSYAQGRLEVQGKLPKDTYVYAEPVDIELIFTNTSNQVVHKSEVKEVRVVVQDETGKTLRGYVSEIHFGAIEKDYQPRESTGYVSNLNRCYAPLFSFYIYARAFPIGNYTVVLAYYNADSVIIEQRFPFRVVEPTGEDAIVFTKLKTILNGDKPQYPTFGVLIDSLESLYWQYPNNVYTRITITAIISFHKILKKDISNCTKYYNEVFTKYPDTGMGMMYASGLLYNMHSKTEKESFLKNLQKNMRTEAGKRGVEAYLRDIQEQQ